MLFDEPPGSSPAEVLSFPAPAKGRVQDIVLKLLLDGQSYRDIAETVGLTEENVKKLARSTWAKQELAARLAANPEQSESALANLLRVHAFDAINAVHDVLTGSHVPSKFQCAKWLLDKYLDASGQTSKSPIPASEEALKARVKELDLQLADERKNQITL
jgi:hypothetical protein